VFYENFIGASDHSTIEAREPQPGIYNYFQGNDPDKWRTNIHAYSEVLYKNVWPQIDLRLYPKGQALEQEFVVRPGGDPTKIQVAYRGIDSLEVAENGSLQIHTPFGDLREHQPRVFQLVRGKRIAVMGRFKLTGATSYTFEVGPHRTEYALVIDPTLSYSTYLGGTNNDVGYSIAVDSIGNIHVTGSTLSSDFPTTPGAFQTTNASAAENLPDAFVAVFDPTKSGSASLVYSTYFGGDREDVGAGIAVDALGNTYVAGSTRSDNFPATPGTYENTFIFGGWKVFVAKFGFSGSLVYSSAFQGSINDFGNAIAVDGSGNSYVTGVAESPDFPITPGTFQPSCPVFFDIAGRAQCHIPFVTKLNAAGSALVYSTYLGGSSFLDNGRGIAVDSSGNAYVTGVTDSSDFPITPGALQPVDHLGGGCPQCGDAFVSKLNATGSALLYSTFLGGSDFDLGTSIAVDSLGDAYVAGQTFSSDFPTTTGVLQPTQPSLPTAGSGFVARLNSDGSALVYSTYLGGQADTTANGIAVDSQGDAYITGSTRSAPNLTNFPVTPDAFQNAALAIANSGYDPFVTKLNPTGSTLLYSTYLGGSSTQDFGNAIAIDSNGNAYLTGSTRSTDFPTTSGAFSSSLLLCGGFNSCSDAFVAEITIPTQSSSAGFTVHGVQQNTGGAGGFVTVSIVGTGFQPGAVATLVCPGRANITAAFSSVTDDGTTISATFDLTGAALGTCSMVVTNTGGATASLPNSFNIEQGTESQLTLSLLGRSVLPAGRPQQYYVVVGNQGNNDAFFVPVWISLPASLTFQLPGEVLPIPQPVGGPQIDFSQASLSVQTDTQIIIPWLIPVLAPGEPVAIPVQLTAPTSSTPHQPFQVQVWANPPLVSSPADIQVLSNLSNAQQFSTPGDPSCYRTLLQFFLQELVAFLGELIPSDCAFAVATYYAQIFESMLDAVLSRSVRGSVASLGQTIYGLASISIACAKSATPVLKVADFILQSLINVAGNGDILVCLKRALQAILSGLIIFAQDPNDKDGPQGAGQLQYLSGSVPLPYVVFFGNEDSATAPAQTVLITDQLDLAKDDLSTFGFDLVAVGAQFITPPLGLNDFTQTMDLRPAVNSLVKINGHLDTGTGLITWSFASLDPTTLQPPTDPLAGFLPPGAGGSVLFTVKPKRGLSTGTQVQNQATVTFDVNAPIATPTWTNTLDNDKPISHVLALPAIESSTTFNVQWSGTDVGAGVQDYTVFVSDNGGTFIPVVVNSISTSATFTGQIGHTYGFVSQARDLAGNIEDLRTTGDTSTLVNLPPVANAGPAQTVECTSPNGTPVTLDGSASTDPDGDALSFQWTDQNGNVVGTAAKVTVPAVPLGTFTYTLKVTDSANLSSTAGTSVTIRDTTPPALTLSKSTVTAVIPTASATTMPVSLTGIASATDICDANPTITNNAPAAFPIGLSNVTFTATDHSGNASQKTLTVQVEYVYGGINPPIPNAVFTVGRAVPIKFQLFAADHTIVSMAVANLQAFRVTSTGLVPVTVVPAGTSNTGTLFRYDPTAKQYVYTLSTNGYVSGTYVLRVLLNDNTTHDVSIALH
jgi:hypothetical protein